jgi:hypothetical protein
MIISLALRTWQPNSASTTQDTFPLKTCLFTTGHIPKNSHVQIKEFYLSWHQQIQRGQPSKI